MINEDYIRKLTNSRWKNKAFKIIKRDGFRCTVCGSKNRLQVHHTFYYADYRDPWLYPNESLLTVCKKCHRAFHEFNESEIRPNPGSPKFKKVKKSKMPQKPKKKKHHRALCLAEMQQIRGVRIKERIRR